MKCPKCKADLPEGAAYCPACGKKQAGNQRKPLRRPNGSGTVYKQSGRRRKPWVARKGDVFVGCYEKKSEALAALDALSGKTLTEKYNMTFADVYESWKAERFKDLSESAQTNYRVSYSAMESLHGMKFRDIRTADFQAVIDKNETKKSHSTLEKYRQLMMQLSKWAAREEIITTNFAAYVRLPKEEKQEKETFSDADIAALEADGSEAAMVALCLIYTGMRLGELFSLRVEDYHGSYCIGGEKTEAGRNRVIPIRPEGRRYFQHFVDLADGPLLISGYSGQRNGRNYRERDYYPMLERLGIERKTPHATRHTFASWAVRAGIQPEVLQKILGHASYTTTADIYVHTDIEQLVAAVEK